jgi:indole-3-glycerol phosphate synthase
VRTDAPADFLASMASASRARAAELAPRRAELEARARTAPPPRPLVLDAAGFDLLCEVKFASPAAGVLAGGASAPEAAARARRYAAAGAAGISVLTEPTRFGGALAHLAAAAAAVGVPVLCKDFLVDPLQVLEARAAGASGVLFVLRLLDEPTLAAMLAAADAHGLFVLLEAFDAADLARAARLVPGRERARTLVGVNCRDLASLAMVPARHQALAPELPRSVACVAESGVAVERDARAVATAGYGLALVGSALMRAADPDALVRSLLAAGRAGIAERGEQGR